MSIENHQVDSSVEHIVDDIIDTNELVAHAIMNRIAELVKEKDNE